MYVTGQKNNDSFPLTLDEHIPNDLIELINKRLVYGYYTSEFHKETKKALDESSFLNNPSIQVFKPRNPELSTFSETANIC